MPKHITQKSSQKYKEELSKWLYLNRHREHEQMLKRHKLRKKRKKRKKK